MNRKEEERILQLLRDVPSEPDGIGDLSDSGDDLCEESEHASGSEISADEVFEIESLHLPSPVDADQRAAELIQGNQETVRVSLQRDALAAVEPGRPHILGKDQTTKWYVHPISSRRVRTPRHNIVTHLPGVKGVTRNAKTPVEAWMLFFPPDVLELIVNYTNDWIEAHKAQYSRDRDASITNAAEIKAVIGLLYLGGVYVHLIKIWTTSTQRMVQE